MGGLPSGHAGGGCTEIPVVVCSVLELTLIRYGQYFRQRLLDLGRLRDRRILSRMPGHHDHDGFFGGWTTEHFSQEFHRVRCVRQCCQPGMVQRCHEETGSHADALGNVVILESGTIIELAPALGENYNQPGCDLQVGFLFVGADRLKRFQSFIAGSTGVEFSFFRFGGETNPVFELGI